MSFQLAASHRLRVHSEKAFSPVRSAIELYTRLFSLAFDDRPRDLRREVGAVTRLFSKGQNQRERQKRIYAYLFVSLYIHVVLKMKRNKKAVVFLPIFT